MFTHEFIHAVSVITHLCFCTFLRLYVHPRVHTRSECYYLSLSLYIAEIICSPTSSYTQWVLLLIFVSVHSRVYMFTHEFIYAVSVITYPCLCTFLRLYVRPRVHIRSECYYSSLFLYIPEFTCSPTSSYTQWVLLLIIVSVHSWDYMFTHEFIHAVSVITYPCLCTFLRLYVHPRVHTRSECYYLSLSLYIPEIICSPTSSYTQWVLLLILVSVHSWDYMFTHEFIYAVSVITYPCLCTFLRLYVHPRVHTRSECYYLSLFLYIPEFTCSPTSSYTQWVLLLILVSVHSWDYMFAHEFIYAVSVITHLCFCTFQSLHVHPRVHIRSECYYLSLSLYIPEIICSPTSSYTQWVLLLILVSVHSWDYMFTHEFIHAVSVITYPCLCTFLRLYVHPRVHTRSECYYLSLFLHIPEIICSPTSSYTQWVLLLILVSVHSWDYMFTHEFIHAVSVITYPCLCTFLRLYVHPRVHTRSECYYLSLSLYIPEIICSPTSSYTQCVLLLTIVSVHSWEFVCPHKFIEAVVSGVFSFVSEFSKSVCVLLSLNMSTECCYSPFVSVFLRVYMYL